jgi:AraC family transcriptional regulator
MFRQAIKRTVTGADHRVAAGPSWPLTADRRKQHPKTRGFAPPTFHPYEGLVQPSAKESPMPGSSNDFTVHETHGPLLLPGIETLASSNRRGWTSLFASEQQEIPFEDRFDAVDDQLIVLHLNGPGRCTGESGTAKAAVPSPPGGLFMVPGGMDFGVRLTGTLRTLHLYVRRALLEEVADCLLTGAPSHIETLPRFGNSDPLLEHLLLGVRDALWDETPSATPYADYLVRAVAARLICHHSSVASARKRIHAPARMASHQLDSALDFMQANLEQSIDLPAIARTTGLSPVHFARQFRRTTGKPPHRYLVQLRIERATRLLRATDDGIADIAFACGFANQEHMTRLFRQHLGTTPGAYRRAVST